MKHFKKILHDRAEVINRILMEIMKEEGGSVSPKLKEAMEYTLFAGGKRVRPFLTVEAAHLINGNIEAAKKVGAALELIHTYSLIHDDLPAMDNDDYRRGKLTNHKIYGSGMAILAGDALLTYAFNILARINILPCEHRLQIINLVSEAAGFQGMVGGQALDIDTENSSLSLEELKIMHRAKTGALFECSLLAGAYCGNPTSKEIAVLKNFAKHLGLTFQIVDDILDITGNDEKLGKTTGQDEKLNKTTYPSLLGLKKARAEAQKNARLARDTLSIFAEDKVSILLNLVDFIVNRQW